MVSQLKSHRVHRHTKRSMKKNEFMCASHSVMSVLPTFRILPYFYGKTTYLRRSPEISAICTEKNKMEPPAKRKPARFLSSWTLPPGITASSKGLSFAYCKILQGQLQRDTWWLQ